MSNKRAFTLRELLVVMAIMGFMGTLSVAGYRAMRRGMEERSVMQNVNQFIRSAYQRAQIDRQPVSVYFWNETLRDASNADETVVVVGKAVAVRRAGRVTMVDGERLYDEFGDLSFNRLVLDADDDDEEISGDSSEGEGIFMYKLTGNEGNNIERSVIDEHTVRSELRPDLALGGQGTIISYAYVVSDKNGVDWRVGDAYGFEFAELTLPHGYIFGSNYSRNARSPIAGEEVLRFVVSGNTGSGATSGTSGKSTRTVSSLRPGASGQIEARAVAQSENPTKSLDN